MAASRTFLVEAYASERSQLGPILDQARRAAGGRHGTVIRHLRSILVPDDETCFHLFEAESIDALSVAIMATGIQASRIVEVAT